MHATANKLINDHGFLRHFWHPVCTLRELAKARPDGRGPLSAVLLGERLAIVELNGKVVAYRDRCPHRSAQLSLGQVTEQGLRCPYHGWSFNPQGMCVHIPSCPGAAIPERARAQTYECEVRYGIVWVRLDPTFGVTEIPFFSAADDPRYRLAMDEPYTWSTSAARRWENFTDLAHFAFVHPITLFDPAFPVPPVVPLDRAGGQLRWSYCPPREILQAMDKMSNMGPASYRCAMPFTVNLEYERFVDGSRSVLWMTSSPLDERTCRNFFIFAREIDKEGSDLPYLEFQHKVLREDRPVIESQSPAEILLDELAVSTDKVSVQYRRWLRELEAAAAAGRDAFARCLFTERLESVAAR